MAIPNGDGSRESFFFLPSRNIARHISVTSEQQHTRATCVRHSHVLAARLIPKPHFPIFSTVAILVSEAAAARQTNVAVERARARARTRNGKICLKVPPRICACVRGPDELAIRGL